MLLFGAVADRAAKSCFDFEVSAGLAFDGKALRAREHDSLYHAYSVPLEGKPGRRVNGGRTSGV